MKSSFRSRMAFIALMCMSALALSPAQASPPSSQPIVAKTASAKATPAVTASTAVVKEVAVTKAAKAHRAIYAIDTSKSSKPAAVKGAEHKAVKVAVTAGPEPARQPVTPASYAKQLTAYSATASTSSNFAAGFDPGRMYTETAYISNTSTANLAT